MPNPHDTQEPQTLIATKETKYGVIIVDACDADLLADARVWVKKGAWTHYAQNYLGSTNSRGKYYATHRLVLERVMGRNLLAKEQVDHANGNGLDNRRANLRIANSSQNSANARLCKDSTSGYKGVTWSKVSKKWHAQIMHNRRRVHLGFYDDPATAHEAYMRAAVAYFGEFANDGTGK